MPSLFRTVFIILLVALGSAAHAQDPTDSRLTTFCNQYSINHSPNTSAEYQPGIDAEGKTVTPADIGSSPDTDLYPLRIPLEMNIFERFNLDIAEDFITDASIVDIMVYEDGRVTYNGQDISSEIKTFCVENNIITPSPPRAKIPDSSELRPLDPPQDDEIIKGEYH